MLSNILTALTVSAAAVSAAAVPASDASSWSFSVYQGTSCTLPPPLSMAGTGSSSCSPPPEYFFGSVLVHSDAGGACSVAFYKQDNGTSCSGKVAAAPGKITVGKCYNFPSNDIPLTYQVTC